ncbi:MAG: MBOAT family protein, partial [Oscillospiraceae bacterium]
MVFSSLFFMFVYLPVVLVLYYITPLKFRNAVLLIANLIFYGWGEPIYILIMFVSIAIDYTHGMLVTKAKNAGNDKAAKL